MKYHEMFILTPWLMFGGVDADSNYMIGDCGVYLDLVGQARAGMPLTVDG